MNCQRLVWMAFRFVYLSLIYVWFAMTTVDAFKRQRKGNPRMHSSQTKQQIFPGGMQKEHSEAAGALQERYIPRPRPPTSRRPVPGRPIHRPPVNKGCVHPRKCGAMSSDGESVARKLGVRMQEGMHGPQTGARGDARSSKH